MAFYEGQNKKKCIKSKKFCFRYIKTLQNRINYAFPLQGLIQNSSKVFDFVFRSFLLPLYSIFKFDRGLSLD